jgi:hypothetical protein
MDSSRKAVSHGCPGWAISAANDVDRMPSIAGTVNQVQRRSWRSADYFDPTGLTVGLGVSALAYIQLPRLSKLWLVVASVVATIAGLAWFLSMVYSYDMVPHGMQAETSLADRIALLCTLLTAANFWIAVGAWNRIYRA